MPPRVLIDGPEVRQYRAPKLTTYGAAIKLTANGSKNSLENNGGTCGTGTNKIRC